MEAEIQARIPNIDHVLSEYSVVSLILTIVVLLVRRMGSGSGSGANPQPCLQNY